MAPEAPPVWTANGSRYSCRRPRKSGPQVDAHGGIRDTPRRFVQVTNVARAVLTYRWTGTSQPFLKSFGNISQHLHVVEHRRLSGASPLIRGVGGLNRGSPLSLDGLKQLVLLPANVIAPGGEAISRKSAAAEYHPQAVLGPELRQRRLQNRPGYSVFGPQVVNPHWGPSLPAMAMPSNTAHGSKWTKIQSW